MFLSVLPAHFFLLFTLVCRCACALNRGVKPGDRYVSVICGNHKRKTAVVEGMAEFACPEVFNFLIRGAKSAVVEFLLKEKEMVGKDKCLGSFKVQQYARLVGFVVVVSIVPWVDAASEVLASAERRTTTAVVVVIVRLSCGRAYPAVPLAACLHYLPLRAFLQNAACVLCVSDICVGESTYMVAVRTHACKRVLKGVVDHVLSSPFCSQVNVAEVMANDDKLDGEWEFAGEKAKGAMKLRLQ